MADRGIIFSAPMVRALLDGLKTQTRRLLSLRGYRGFSEFGPSDTPGYDWHFRRADSRWCDVRDARLRELLPYAPGDRLYVREAFRLDTAYDKLKPTAAPREAAVFFEAGSKVGDGVPGKLHPSIHLPRHHSRLTLTVSDVRVQRVGEISEADAQAEGAEYGYGEGAEISQRRMFELLWNSLHTKPGETWEANPWVVAVTFTVAHGNIDRNAP
jgi:hypothetical protein